MCAVRVPASTAKRGPNPNPNPNQLGDERLQEGGEHCGGRHLARLEVGLDEGVLRHEEEEERSGSGGWAGGHHVRGHDHRPRQNGAPSCRLRVGARASRQTRPGAASRFGAGELAGRDASAPPREGCCGVIFQSSGCSERTGEHAERS